MPFALTLPSKLPMTWEDIGAILPVLVLFVTGSVVLVIDLFLRGWTEPVKPGSKPILSFLSLLGTVVAVAIASAGLGGEATTGRGYFLDAIHVDKFSSAMSLLILLGTLLSLLGSVDALQRRDLEHGEFYALVLYAAGAMVLFVESASLILLFLSLETLSMALYILTAYTRDEKRSVEGSLKYFILGGFSSGFLLLGLAFLYGATRRANLLEIKALLDAPGSAVDYPLLLAGMALTITGLFFKVGAFPFQSWLPDAYEGAPTIVTSFMAVTVKVASFAVLLRIAATFLGLREGGVRDGLLTSLSVVSALTMIFGNVVAIAQASVKRMLAYSAIAHTGYLLIGVVASLGGKVQTPGQPSGGAVIFYLFSYALMTIGAFTLMAFLGRGNEDKESFDAYKGLARKEPVIAFALLILMVSFAGIPPTAGFWGKLYIFREAIETGHWVLALIGILTSVVSVYYYLRLVVTMYMQPEEEPASLSLEPRSLSGVAIAFAVASVALVGLFPDILFRISASCGLK